MSYIGFKRDRCYLAYYKSDFKHKFSPILINDNMFIINVDDKIIFCLEEEDKFSEKLCLSLIKHRNNGKTIIVSGMLGLLIFFLPVEEAIDIGTIPQASNEIIRNIPRTAQEELVLELRGGNDISESMIKILLIWTMSRGYTTTSGLQPKPINPQFNPPGSNPRIAPKLQENPVDRNNLEQGTCKSSQHPSMETQTQLEMARRAPMIDMDKEYQKFLLIKHPETECSQERFKALSSDPQRKMIDESSIKEAIIILEAEGRGIVEEAERPDLSKGKPNLDFKVKGPDKYKYVDVKEPRNFGRGNQDLDSAARRMGHKIYKQKEQSKFGILRDEVLHIVNLELLDPGQQPDYQKNIFIPHSSEGIIIIDITKR
jgi:hypothetical protein